MKCVQKNVFVSLLNSVIFTENSYPYHFHVQI